MLVRLVVGIAKRRRCLAPIELRRCQAQNGARSRRFATCAKGPGGQTTEALLYLMPRSLGATCCCS